MGADTRIEWARHTWNPVSGCAKVGPGCEFCWAAALPPRMRRGAEWGEGKPRVPASESYWFAPFGWARKAREVGERHRVFVGSTMDIGEDTPEMQAVRDRALAMCALTPDLDWLWLSKRLHVLARYFADPRLYQRVLDAARWLRTKPGADGISRPRRGVPNIGISDPDRLATWYPNLWVGASVEDQERTARIGDLRRIPSRVRFLSVEPMLSAIEADLTGISWVIVGGESGPKARPTHPDWVRGLRDQCTAADVPFFFKGWGEWAPEFDYSIVPASCSPGDLTEWTTASSSDPRRVGEVTWAAYPRGMQRDADGFAAYETLRRVGKKQAGRLLDGRTWDQVPEVTP